MESKGRRGRPQRRWRDEVKVFLMGRMLSEREGIVMVRDREVLGRMLYRSELVEPF